MNNNLKNCPFCGSKNVTKNLTIGLTWQAGCNDCGCRTAEYNFSGDAVSSWNRRPDDAEGSDQDDGIRKAADIMAEMSINEPDEGNSIPENGSANIEETPF